jgi:hypothetical protein
MIVQSDEKDNDASGDGEEETDDRKEVRCLREGEECFFSQVRCSWERVLGERQAVKKIPSTLGGSSSSGRNASANLLIYNQSM